MYRARRPQCRTNPQHPRSNVLEFQTKYAKVLIRPSGTEPKVKVYLSSRAATMEQAAANNQAILEEITNTYLK